MKEGRTRVEGVDVGEESVVLGVDPSIANAGYAVLAGARLRAAGCIRTRTDEPDEMRVWTMFSEVLALIREHGVDEVAVEMFEHFYRSPQRETAPNDLVARFQGRAPARSGRHDRAAVNPKAIYAMQSAATAVHLAALSCGCTLSCYPVREWKGGVRVSKEATRRRAQTLYGVTTRNDNITDAIMIADHHARSRGRGDERGVVLADGMRREALSGLFGPTPSCANPREPLSEERATPTPPSPEAAAPTATSGARTRR